jgi:hypothetical protein
MAINLAWDGQEAEAGLNKTAHLLRNTGIAALDAAQDFSKMVQDRVKSLGLNDSEIRSLSRLSELDRERALDKYEESENLRKMSKNSQLLYEQMTKQAEEAAAAESIARARAKSRQDQLASLTVLEKDALFAKEKERALLLSMTGQQIKDYEARKASAAQAKAEAEQRQKQLAGMSALERQRFIEKENRQKMILGMSAKQQLAFEAQEKAAEKARAKSERWADMSWIQKIKESLKGAQDIKATLEMVRGLFNLVTSAPRAALRGLGGIVELGAELETMQVKFGVLLGSFDRGAQSLEVLRQITRDMGVPLKDLVGAFSSLVGGGVGGGDAEKLIRTFSAIAPLLGQGGVGQLATGIGAMAKSGVAQADALNQMQGSGLRVYEALAERLTRVTGVLHGVREAQDAVELHGRVYAITG